MNRLPIFLTAVGVLGAIATFPASAAGEQGFYQKHEEGWFWYEEPPDDPEPEPAEPVQVPEIAEAQPQAEPDGPAPMSAAWLRDNIPEYRDRAIDNPTPTNIRALLYLQRMAMDKASRYTEATQRVVSGDRLLDEYAQYPQGTGFVQQIQQEAENLSDRMLRDMTDDTGLMFFFESSCRYCRIQTNVIKTMQRLYGLHVVPVSLDGKPMPGNPFPDFITDRGVAERLSINVTPTIVLAHPPDGMQVIARGLLSLQELKRRVLAAAAERGWVDVSQYQKTRPSNNHGPDISDIELSQDEEINAEAIVREVNQRLSRDR